jgi:hypothetical protein
VTIRFPLFALAVQKKKLLNLQQANILAFIQGGSNMTGTNCDLFTHK